VSTDPDVDSGCPVVGPADLRQRVLYALDPGTADELCERHLGQQARSPDYEADTSVAAGTSATAGASVAAGTSATAGASATGEDASDETVQTDDPLSGTRLGGLSALVGPQAAVLGVLVVVVLATSVGAAVLGGLVDVDAGDDSSAADGAATPTATAASDSRETITPAETEGRDWGGWEAIPNGLPNSGETATPTPASEGGEEQDVRDFGAARYADLAPTCERSFLHVVQIQMNALKYNDNATNDGIRTVRRFASPQNREAVGGLEAYVRIIQRESYAPMLTYDSAEYEPSRVAADTARVQVTTREDGNVTGRYVFRLGKQDGGEYDGCWMTEGVRPLTDTTHRLRCRVTGVNSAPSGLLPNSVELV